MTPYKAYHRATHTVTKTRQVVMLYDGMIRFMQQACEAMEKKDYETRYNKLARVSEIAHGLQACLDFEAGGDSAKILYDFYASLEVRIFQLHRSNDAEQCRKLITEVKNMRDMWDRFDRDGEVNSPAPANSAPGTAPSTSVSA